MRRPAMALICLLPLLVPSCCRPSDEVETREVVLYCAMDQVHTRAIIDLFEERTGIEVFSKWDTEASKTTGLVGALAAEKDNPRADVFWSNEIMQTIRLKNEGVLAAYRSPSADGIPARFLNDDGYWSGFAARARVIIYHKGLVPADDLPDSIRDLADPRWRGRTTIARPLFGTTATHAVCLDQVLGEAKMLEWLDAVVANDAFIADGNGQVKDRVASGRSAFGLTDSDDANVAILAGENVGIVLPDQDELGTLIIPNTVAMIAGGPHPEEAKALIDFILSAEVEALLAKGRSVQMPLHPGVTPPEGLPPMAEIRAMDVDFEAAATRMDAVFATLRERFLR